jgi:uncharacterized protein DUF2637
VVDNETKPVAPAKVKPVRWWRKGRVWRRIGSDLTALIVGVIAAIISWTHIVHVVIEYGKQTQAILGLQVANLYPISVDGAMIVGVIAAADDRANGLEVRRWARVSTWFGGIFSIAAQVTSAWPYGPVAWVIAAVPSGALIVVIEVLTKRGKLAAGTLKVRWYHSKKRRARMTATVAVSVPVAPAELTAETLPGPVAPVAVPSVSAPVTGTQTSSSVRPPRRSNGRPDGGRRMPSRSTEGKPVTPTKAAKAAKAAVVFMGPEEIVTEATDSPVESAVFTVDDGPRAIGTVDDVIVAEVVPNLNGVR